MVGGSDPRKPAREACGCLVNARVSARYAPPPAHLPRPDRRRRTRVARPRRRRRAQQARHRAHRRRLPGEPQLRQPVRRLGGRERPGQGRPGAHRPGRPGRRALRLPPPRRRQPDLTAAGRGLRPDQPLPQPAVLDRRLHRPDGHDLPAAGRVRPERRREGRGTRRRMHPRPRPPLLPGAVPARRRQAGPLRDRQRRARPDDGDLRHARAADLPLPAPARAIPATRSPTTSSRRPSVGRSSITSGWPPRPRPTGRTPSTTAAATTSTRWSTPTACRSATRSTPRPRGRT